MTSKKTVVMIVDGGHLRKSLEFDHKNPNPDLPILNAENINRILHNCVTDDEDLQRIYYYDCAPFTGRFHDQYPGLGHKKERAFAIYESDLRERIRQGSKFHIINPIIKPTEAYPEIPSTEMAEKTVWRISDKSERILRELGQKDLFVVRLGRMTFKGWAESTTKSGPKYYPDVQQKGVDMLIGIDIAVIAMSDQANKIIFVTGDTDFVPALEFARGAGRQVQIVMIELPGKKISSHLKKSSDYCREVPWPKQKKVPWPQQKKGKPPNAMTNAFIKKANKLTVVGD